MTETFALAALWLVLAVLAAVLANHLRISVALVEICVGIAAGTVAEHYSAAEALGADVDWLHSLAFLPRHFLAERPSRGPEPSELGGQAALSTHDGENTRGTNDVRS